MHPWKAWYTDVFGKSVFKRKFEFQMLFQHHHLLKRAGACFFSLHYFSLLSFNKNILQEQFVAVTRTQV